MTSFFKYTLFCLALAWGPAAKGDGLATQGKCEMLILLLPEALQDFPMASCEHSKGNQVTLSTTVTVPANLVVEVERVLIASYGIEPLRFVCCGYETEPVVVPLENDHPFANDIPNGAFRSIVLSFFAEAYTKDNIGKRVHDLGAFDAAVKLELVDH